MIRLGMIGLGKMGLSHLAIANSLDQFKISAVSDLSRVVGKTVARYTGSRFVRNYRQLLVDPEIEAVVVSVPTHLHLAVAEAAIGNGKHVFLEKPLTLSADASARLAEQARQASLATQVGYVNRFNPVFDHLRSLVKASTFGAPLEYECTMRGNVVGDEGAQGWRNDHRNGGGCLYEYGSHCIDLSLFLFGSFATLNSARLERRVSSNVEDYIEAQVTHGSGLRGRLIIDWADKDYRKATNTVFLLTDQVLLVADKQEIAIFENPQQELDEAMRHAQGKVPHKRINITDLDTDVPYYLRGEDFTRQLVSFHDLVRNRSEAPVARFADGCETDRLIGEMFAAGVR